MKKKEKAKKRKTSFLLALGFCVLAGLVAIKLVQFQIDINDSKQVLIEKRAQHQQILDENEDLAAKLSDEKEFAKYVEALARDGGFIYPGERPYYDISYGG